MTEYVIPRQRLDYAKEAREPYRAMAALDRSIELEPVLRELVKIRASQINGCAFCLDMHLRDAREMGEDSRRLDTLAGWRDAPFFTARERAALALTEAVTRLPDGPVPEPVYAEVERHFDPSEIAQLLFAIVAINAWNRLAVTAQRTPG